MTFPSVSPILPPSYMLMTQNAQKSIKNANDCLKLQADLDLLSCWSSLWKLMSQNVSKRFDFSYEINNQIVKNCDSHKDLGVFLTANLTGSSHIKQVTAKA